MKASGRGGYTLVELLLALVVLSLVLTVVAGVLSGVLGGSERIARSSGESAEAGEIEDLIADDLAFLALPAPESPMILESGATGSKISFFSSSGAKAAWGEVTSPIHFVTYSVGPMSSGGNGLFRLEEPLAETENAVYDKALLLAQDVTKFKVQAYDGQEWHDKWPIAGKLALPVFIRIEYEIKGDDGGADKVYMVESTPPVELMTKPQSDRRYSG